MKQITIPIALYEQLQEESLLLGVLYTHGVKDWEKWEDAHEEYLEESVRETNLTRRG